MKKIRLLFLLSFEVLKKFHLAITVSLTAGVIILAILGYNGVIDESKPSAPAAPLPKIVDADFCNNSNSHDIGTIISERGPRTVIRLQNGFHVLQWIDSPPDSGFNSTAMLDGNAVEVTPNLVTCMRQFVPKSSIITPALPSDYFVGLTAANPYEHDLWNTDVWPWYYVGDPRYNLINAVVGAFNDTSARYGVYFQYDESGQRNESMSGARLTAQCGAEWAAACVGSNYPYYPRNCDAVYNGEAMVTWYSQTSQEAVVKHELQHCQTTRNEAYLPGGVCIATDTIMGCGPQSPKDYTTHDDIAWAEAHYPHEIKGAVVDTTGRYGPLLIWYATPDVPITGDSNCTRVALWAGVLGWNNLQWTGVYGSCNAGIQGIGIPYAGCIEFYVSAENGEWPTWGRNLIRAGNTSCN